MGEREYELSLEGIKIDRQSAVLLVERMNKHWPGKYRLYWPTLAFNMINPLASQRFFAQPSQDPANV